MKLFHIAAGIAATLSVTLMLSSCGSMPEHAQYIPKDAVAVAGINTRELSKKIAWNAILGSKILDEIKEKQSHDAASRLDKAGIAYMSTSYVYLHRTIKGSGRITGLVPLSDAPAWEAYMKQAFPNATVKQVKDRKEALLSDDMYVGWNKKLLIVMSIPPTNVWEQMQTPDTVAAATETDTATIRSDSLAAAKLPRLPALTAVKHADPAAYEQEMALAFSVTKENSVVSDNRFATLEKEGHDITLWINEEALMNQSGIGKMPFMSMVRPLMKDVVVAAGIDFEKGRITGDARYYAPEAYSDAWKEYGKENIDKEILERLPAQNLNVLFSWHLAPKGVKAMLEKSGIAGLLGFGLLAQGLSLDDILDAFTGDIVYALNDFSATNTASGDSLQQGYTSDVHMNYTCALKINNKDAFKKLLLLAQNQQILFNNGNNTYRFGPDMGAPANNAIIAVDEQYMVIANTQDRALAFLQGKYKGQKLPETVHKEIYGHPAGVFADVKAIVNATALPPGMSNHDSVVAVEARKLVSNLTVGGGEYKSGAFAFRSQVNLADQGENSLLQLLGFLVKTQNGGNTTTQVAAQ